MNYVVEEIIRHCTEIDELMHYGMPRRSGRYPWGSGENPYQHTGDFLSRIEELKKEGKDETSIAKEMGLTTTEYRIQYSLATKERRAERVAIVESYRAKGYSLNKIAELMGYNNDSSVRSLLNQHTKDRKMAAERTADFLRDRVDELGMIDVSKGVEYGDSIQSLGVSRTKMDEAIYALHREGYEVYKRRVPNATNPGKHTTIKILCKPGTPYRDIYQDDKIYPLDDYVTRDGGDHFEKRFVYPASMDSKRMAICYAEDGGKEKDGLVEIRRGVQDLDLGKSRYAQVRILVDGTHYIKGMAVYSDDLPDGVDIRFNTNKSKDVSKMDVLKPISDNPDNPFGSLIKEKGGQSYYDAPDGTRKLSLINKRAEEGDWDEWSNKLSTQFLAKQSDALVKKQLDLSKSIKQEEFDEINSLTNNTVKRRLMQSFADDCDAAAVHLKAASLPRQHYQVIIPVPTLKDNEVYAPNYRDGEEVALIRYPHGGTFEIPLLRVNNKNAEASKYITKQALDAVGINSRVAERLSGADFDGDTVMVIPTKGVNGKHGIISTPPLKGLKDFDPKMEYPKTPGMLLMKDKARKTDNTQMEMGKISNLITDMTIAGAGPEDLAKAVRHSMVVIDAGKHELNYKKSEKDNEIAALNKKWRTSVDENGKVRTGASTLISRSSGPKDVLQRHGDAKVNMKGKPWYDPTRPEGAKIYASKKKNEKGQPWYDPSVPEGEYFYAKPWKETYVDKHGKTQVRTTKSTQMAEVDNAFELSSGTKVETRYAEYANFLKNMANRTRIAREKTEPMKSNPEAKKKYKKEVDSINAKLILCKRNAPKERQADLIVNSKIKALKKEYGDDITQKELGKIRQMEKAKARLKVGAKRDPIIFTDEEWEAVQAGAISSSKLEEIMQYADLDKLKERATPKNQKTVSQGKINRIKMMRANGYTMGEIADAVGLSRSTVAYYLGDKGGDK